MLMIRPARCLIISGSTLLLPYSLDHGQPPDVSTQYVTDFGYLQPCGGQIGFFATRPRIGTKIRAAQPQGTMLFRAGFDLNGR